MMETEYLKIDQALNDLRRVRGYSQAISNIAEGDRGNEYPDLCGALDSIEAVSQQQKKSIDSAIKELEESIALVDETYKAKGYEGYRGPALKR